MKKRTIMIIAVAGVLLAGIGCGIWYLFFGGSDSTERKWEAIQSIEIDRESFEAGSKISKADFTVIGTYITADGERKETEISDVEIDLDEVPETGRNFKVGISVGELSRELELYNTREILETYHIGKYEKGEVKAILYENGEFEIEGKGEVANFPEGKVPWLQGEFSEDIRDFSYVDPFATIESLDYWFKGCKSLEQVTCQIPDSVRSMRETFAETEELKKVSSLASADNLQDITGMCRDCIELTEVGALPAKLKVMKEAFSGCVNLINPADVSGCKELENMELAYAGDIALSRVSIHENVKNLKGAFQGCVNLKEGVLPSEAKNISEIYSGCTHMTSIAGEITEACDSWSGAFENCYFLAGELKITTRNQSLNGVFTNAAISGDPLILLLSYIPSTEKEDTVQILSDLHDTIQSEIDNGSNIKIQ